MSFDGTNVVVLNTENAQLDRAHVILDNRLDGVLDEMKNLGIEDAVSFSTLLALITQRMTLAFGPDKTREALESMQELTGDINGDE